jgi:flavin reductase (DIM6/NTAB) family NADH-FMN oxidoreductase RutF
MEFDLATLKPLDRYKLLTGLVVPRPIAFVSSMSAEGVHNAAPFSFFNMFGATPAVVVLGINLRPGGKKDSYNNIVSLGEFVINVATAGLAEQLNAASGDYGPEIDEFTMVGLTPVPSVVVRPPRILESPANLECKLLQTVSLGGERALIVGEMVYAHVHDDLLDGLKVDQIKLDAIGRMGGPSYAYTRDLFAMERPVV